MKKLLRPRDYLLLTLGFLGDTFEEVKDPFRLQEQNSLLLYGAVPQRWKRHNFERAAKRMLHTGDIEKVIFHGKPVLKLTSAGLGKWSREFPLFDLSQKSWDGWWRMVGFDIPNKLQGKRGSLRDKLKEFGMGKLQESLYITPYDFGLDLQEFIESHELSPYVEVFEARHTFGSTPQILAWRVWQLDKLNERYEDFFQMLVDKRSFTSLERLDLQKQFEEILLNDPLLPRELLPKDWAGYKVRKLVLGK